MKYLKPVLACLLIIIIFFIIISLLDVLIAAFNPRFYSHAAFVVTFGVGGIFAACYGYIASLDLAPAKSEVSQWSIILTLIISGLIFFFLLSKMEGGEYESAFKAFGATLALGSLLFVKEGTGGKS